MNLVRTYQEEIDKFFREENFYIESREKGHIWMAGRHRQFQVLTVEPLKGEEGGGGQYEIAVRFPLECSDMSDMRDKYSGYIARDGYIVGRNTDGH